MISASSKLRPAIPKVYLYLLAGLMWSGVGLLLSRYAYLWMVPLPAWQFGLILVAGIALGVAIYRFGFSQLAKKNIHRISQIKNVRVCIFAFQEWHNYPLVLVMISLGLFLRVYSPVPKSLLAIMYLGIGAGLFLASIHYYLHIKQSA